MFFENSLQFRAVFLTSWGSIDIPTQPLVKNAYMEGAIEKTRPPISKTGTYRKQQPMETLKGQRLKKHYCKVTYII